MYKRRQVLRDNATTVKSNTNKITNHFSTTKKGTELSAEEMLSLVSLCTNAKAKRGLKMEQITAKEVYTPVRSVGRMNKIMEGSGI